MCYTLGIIYRIKVYEPEITIYGKNNRDEVFSSVGQSASLTQMRSQVRALFRPF